MGTDDLSNKYLGHIKSQSKAIDPPDDESITTLWVGNVEGIICEQDLFDAFYCYGRVLGINILRTSKCAFVEYSLRAEAEAAAASLYNTLVIKGHTLSLNWSKPRPATGLGASRSSSAAEAGSVCAMPAPPGMESAHLSAYALPGMCAPVSVPPPLPPGPPPSSSSEESSHKRQRTAGGTGGVGPAPAMNYSSMDPQRLGAMSK
jgi:pre-mRNA-splicing factor RBM22/SLT11